MANSAEEDFIAFAKKRFKISRHGWPDFFVQGLATRECLGVEVKQGSNKISPAQRLMFAALEASGFKIVVWNPKEPQKLTPWQAYGPKRKPRGKHKRTMDTCAYIRIPRKEHARIAAIAARRGRPHTLASVAGEMLSKGLASEKKSRVGR